MAEIIPPTVIRQISQPITGGEKSVSPGSAQQIGFYAYGGGKEASFVVLAGEGSPTVTGGWVKLAKVQRFQRVSVTVPEGYDPRVITVPITFDATVGDREEGSQKIEADIKTLEWMAGREEHPTSEIAGEPPYVEVYTKIGKVRTNLVPTQFQSLNKKGSNSSSEVWKAILEANPKLGNNADKKLKSGTKVKYPESIVKLVPREEFPLWYISGLTFDANPLRVRGGDRIRQNVVVELTEIVLSPSTLNRVQQESESNGKKYKTFKVTGGSNNTIRKIATEITKGRA